MTSLYCVVQRANDPPGKTINYQFISLVWCNLQFDRVTNRSAFCIYCMIHLPERLKRPNHFFAVGFVPAFVFQANTLKTCILVQYCNWQHWTFFTALAAGYSGSSISNTGTCCSGNQSKNDNSTGCSVHEMFELVLVVVFLFVPVFLVLGPAFFAWLAARVVFVQLCSRALVAHS